MDEAELRRLGTDGLKSAKATEEVAFWCWERSEATGDARFCGLARSLDHIAREWEHHGALPRSAEMSIQESFQRHLESILAADSPEEGSGLARLLREEIASWLAEITF